ncbi:DUF551 domain-containing protein [Escherichia coli]|nr:DUF551 domain-containing protein [Escherichia coli]MEB7307847.1 DUF551 domain-containing protein [Escherichia coli]
MAEFTKYRIIEELKASTQNANGMFEISEDTICALMSMLTSTAPQLPQPAVLSVSEGVLKSLLPDVEKSEFWFEHNGKIFFEGVRFNNAVFEACRAAMLQGADGKPELTVWYGSMPETNGKTNWTAMLHRKGQHPWEGITIERSEHPDRVRYKSDRMRHLIGELSEEPDILEYDADAHSGYVKPGNYPVTPDGWISCSEQMPVIGELNWRTSFPLLVTCEIGVISAYYGFVSVNGDRHYGFMESLKYGDDSGNHPQTNEYGLISNVTHWMPLPEPPL